MKLAKMLRLPARDLVSEIEKVSDTKVLAKIEAAETQREKERPGSGRTTVYHAIFDRRAQLGVVASPEEPRAEDQDAAIGAAFVEGTLPEEDRRAVPEPDTSVDGPLMEVVDEETQAVEQVVAVPSDPEVVEVPAEEVEVGAAPVIPNDQIHVVRDRGDGTKVDVLGHIII